MSTIEIFLWGFGGSVAVEIVRLNQQFYIEPFKVHERYKKVVFWIVKFLLALVGGTLAIAYEIDKPLLAANIGAATPLIIQALSQATGKVPEG